MRNVLRTRRERRWTFYHALGYGDAREQMYDYMIPRRHRAAYRAGRLLFFQHAAEDRRRESGRSA